MFAPLVSSIAPFASSDAARLETNNPSKFDAGDQFDAGDLREGAGEEVGDDDGVGDGDGDGD